MAIACENNTTGNSGSPAMAMQHLDKLPTGYMRQNKGWLTPEKTPQQAVVNRLKLQNRELKDRLAQIEAAVEALTAKKGKK